MSQEQSSERLPALGRSSFHCPHCGSFASQSWHGLYAVARGKDSPPSVPAANAFEKDSDFPGIDAKRIAEFRNGMIEYRDGMRSGRPFFDEVPKNSWPQHDVPNLFLSECYACGGLATWIGEQLIAPAQRNAVAPHPDTPQTILPDFDEARQIVNASPRGAAALLRLAIQKLCIDLGEPGKDLNVDIGSLVGKGLPVRIQQALDAVRVIGHESVHPGELDLKDDRATAEHLFELVNMIIDDRISKPRALDALYAKLPRRKLDGIEQRNQRALGQPKN